MQKRRASIGNPLSPATLRFRTPGTPGGVHGRNILAALLLLCGLALLTLSCGKDAPIVAPIVEEEIPEDPETPETPEDPEVPEDPEIPEVPEIPEIPEDQAPCIITVTAPDGGEAWIEGLDYAITWDVVDCAFTVSIELLRDGVPAAVIADSTLNDGSYDWTAARVDGQAAGYKIRVTDLTGGTVDESAASFEINALPPGPDDFFCVSTTGTRTEGSSTMDIASFGWADEDCYGTIGEAMALLSPGDQLWIDDGTYDDHIRLRPQHSGTPEDYTIVRARNAGRVTLHGDSFGMIDLKACSYVEVSGFRITGVGEIPIYVHAESHHFRIRRTGWNQRAALITEGSHHGLVEDCYAWGGPHRYAFQASNGANRIIFRRCLVRWDFSYTSEPQACFASYTCDKIYYQNCISIDGTDNKGIDTPSEDGLKSFFTPNGSTDCHYEGCISLAMRGAAGWWLEGTTAEGTLTDCIAWGHLVNAADETDTYKPYSFASTADVGSWSVRQCTFGVNDFGSKPVRFDTYNTESMRSSIIYGMTLDAGEYAVSSNLDDHDYNCYWDNTGGRNKNGGVGPHALVDVDPRAAGLSSLVDIDPGSVLDTSGSSGERIGARVLTKIGVSGTLYDEPGWDLDTGESLWPFPYEDQIREDCRQFQMPAGAAYGGSPAMDGERGFCAPGQSLTSYILGYLDR